MKVSPESLKQHEDQYKDGFATYSAALKVANNTQTVYFRRSDGLWCLTGVSRRKPVYNRPKQKKIISRIISYHLTKGVKT